MSARLGRRREDNSSRSTPRWTRCEPRSSSEMQKSCGSLGRWFKRPCRSSSCATPARTKTPLYSSCSRRPRSCAQLSRRRRSRSSVSRPSRSFVCRLDLSGSALDLLSFCFQVCGLLSRHRQRRQRRSRQPTTPPSRNWRLCRRRPSKHARASRRRPDKQESLWRVTSGPWAAMSPSVCGVRSARGSKRPSEWCSHIRGLTSQHWLQATSSQTILTTKVRRPR
jgi:hypothetical protein